MECFVNIVRGSYEVQQCILRALLHDELCDAQALASSCHTFNALFGATVRAKVLEWHEQNYSREKRQLALSALYSHKQWRQYDSLFVVGIDVRFGSKQSDTKTIRIASGKCGKIYAMECMSDPEQNETTPQTVSAARAIALIESAPIVYDVEPQYGGTKTDNIGVLWREQQIEERFILEQIRDCYFPCAPHSPLYKQSVPQVLDSHHRAALLRANERAYYLRQNKKRKRRGSDSDDRSEEYCEPMPVDDDSDEYNPIV